MPNNRYYLTWGGYSVPVVPEKEIPLAQAVEQNSYYFGSFDDQGRLIRWEKILVKRSDITDAYSSFDTLKATPGFFPQTPFSEPARPDFAHALADEKVPTSKILFYVRSTGNGQPVRLFRLMQTSLTVDEYIYNSAGKLAIRRLRRADGSTREWSYDAKGLPSTPLDIPQK
jgi:hypothetical protein